MNISKALSEIRPTLSAGSLKTYTSLLKSVHKNVFKDKEMVKSDFDDCTKILEYLKELKPNQRKTTLSGLVVISDKPKYREAMLQDIKEYSTEAKKMDKSPSQEANWVEPTELNEVFATTKSNATALYKKQKLTMSDLQDIQNYIILCLTSGIYIPPRRSLDWTEFKTKNIDKAEDNYLDKNEFVYNRYKTAKFYNEQRVSCPKELLSILKKWIKINADNTEYLLFDSNFEKLTSVNLNQRFEKIFGKKTSVNILRHVYLTSKFGDEIERSKKMNAVAEDMGTSSAQVIGTYIKKE
jgi:integrase